MLVAAASARLAEAVSRSRLTDPLSACELSIARPRVARSVMRLPVLPSTKDGVKDLGGYCRGVWPAAAVTNIAKNAGQRAKRPRLPRSGISFCEGCPCRNLGEGDRYRPCCAKKARADVVKPLDYVDCVVGRLRRFITLRTGDESAPSPVAKLIDNVAGYALIKFARSPTNASA